jgi:hypothetical protein
LIEKNVAKNSRNGAHVDKVVLLVDKTSKQDLENKL